MNFTLILSVNLTRFDANLYKDSEYSGPVVNHNTIDTNSIQLNNQETAVELAQMLYNFDGVAKIEILDKSGNTLFIVGPTL